MRNLFLLASLLICLTSVNVSAQDTSSAGNQTKTKPGETIDRAVQEAKEHGETIIESCLVNCEDAAVREGVEPARVIELPDPVYPPIARAAHATGTVGVKVIVDVDGQIIAAASITGHPLLQGAAVSAARKARFTPTKVNGQAVKTVGVIQYNFDTL